ncbi:MAG: hypothetical protein CMN34_00515 [Saprospirales bacterium]|nr:hypothetical protein [Saprospirales bacterium]
MFFDKIQEKLMSPSALYKSMQYVLLLFATLSLSPLHAQQVSRDSPIVLHDKECPIIQKDCSMDYQYLARCVMVEINHFRRREGLDTLRYSPTLTLHVADSLLRVSAKRGKSYTVETLPNIIRYAKPRYLSALQRETGNEKVEVQSLFYKTRNQYGHQINDEYVAAPNNQEELVVMKMVDISSYRTTAKGIVEEWKKNQAALKLLLSSSSNRGLRFGLGIRMISEAKVIGYASMGQSGYQMVSGIVGMKGQYEALFATKFDIILLVEKP